MIMNSLELHALSFDRLGSWPRSARMSALAAALIFTVALGYLFLIKPRLIQLKHLEKQQADLKLQYQSEYKQASTLPEQEAQVIGMQKKLSDASRALTAANEMPQLLNTISKLAAANSLEVNLIQPEQESAKAGYITLPVTIAVTGDYHHLALFISQIESLEKIITFRDFSLIALKRKANDDSGSTLLRMNAVATVYRETGINQNDMP